MHISSWPNFIDYLLWVLIIPLCLLIVLLVVGLKCRRKHFIGISLVSFFILFVGAFHLFFDALYATPFYSFTDDAGNFGLYDEYVETQIQVRPESGFPETIPDGANLTRYSYWYVNAASPHHFVMLALELPSDDFFQDEIKRLSQCGFELSKDKSVYLFVPEYQGFGSEVLVDWEQHRLGYFFFGPNDVEFAPKSLAEFYSTVYSNEWILVKIC